MNFFKQSPVSASDSALNEPKQMKHVKWLEYEFKLSTVTIKSFYF